MVKIGTGVITDGSGRIIDRKLSDITDQISLLALSGLEIIIVTSGAIAAGVERLGLEARPKEIPALQAAASVGQGILFEKYVSLFKKSDITVGQILITQYDTTHRQQYLNAQNALKQLLKMKVIPIINENDTTAVDEIKFGDNDTLAALVSVLIEAEMLLALTDIDGLYSIDPRLSDEAELVKTVDEVTPEIENMAAGIGHRFGSGGMITKINAARIVNSAGISMVIANGNKKEVMSLALTGREGTYFKPASKKTSSKKIWICYGRTPNGTIMVDQGAAEALLKKGKSLLPAGIIDVEGDFDVGDTVDVAGPLKVIARGLTNYSARELKKIRGKKSSEIETIGSGLSAEEVIHRDCMVVI